MADDWTVRATDAAPAHAVSVPAQTWRASPFRHVRHLELTAEKQAILLPVVEREGASGRVLFVAIGTFGLGSGQEAPCSFKGLWEAEFDQQRIRRSKNTANAVQGLVVAVIGTVIDLSLKLGEKGDIVLFSLDPALISGMLVVGTVLQLTGLWLVFYKGVWLAKE